MATASLGTFLKRLTRGMAAETLNDHTDRQLVELSLARRDQTAFEAIVQRHGAMVYRVCWRILHQPEDTEDAFQATVLLLAQKLRTVRNYDSLASWLHGVAHRVALQARGRTARRRRHEQRATMTQVERSGNLSAEELLAVLDAELAKLPDKWRLPLILCYLEGRTQEESASQLGWSKSTLRRRLEEAREALGRRLKGRGIAWSAALSAVLLSDCLASAALPSGLVGSTVEAATLIAAGGAAASIVSPKVAVLTEGMVKAMFFRKLKMAAILFLAIAGSGMGLALTVRALPRADARGPVEQPAPQEKPKLDANAGARPGDNPGMPIRSLPGHTDRVTSVAFSPDGKSIATAGWDGTARLWDAQTGKEARRLDAPTNRDYSTSYHLSRVLFSPDDQFIVTAQPGVATAPSVIIWNRRTGEKVHEFLGGPGGVALSADGRLVACATYNALRLYELPGGKLVREIPCLHSIRGDALTFSPDGNTLFSRVRIPRNDPARLGFDPEVPCAWNVATGKERPSVLKGAILAFSPDGRTVANAGVVLQEAATGGLRGRLTGHARAVNGAAFSPDGRTLASAGDDGTVRLWDLPSGKELGRFGKEVGRGEGGWVLAVAFSPDGRTLVSGGLDKTAHIWDVSKIVVRPRVSAERSAAELEADWKDLGGDAPTGYGALGRLVSSPKHAVAFLGKQLQSTKPVDTKRIERLIAELDDERFEVRDQATKELAALGDRVAPALQKALAGGPSAEARRRLVTLLDRLEAGSLSVETVREVRAVEALEAIGTPEARQLLDKLATAPPEMRLTQEAKASADRLAKRSSIRP